MRTVGTWLLASLFILTARAALAQGLLVNVNPNERVALPRPIARHPHAMGQPVPVRQSSYKIKEISVDVTLTDQVARTQVSQSFVNTGSAPLEVCFVFPLPYDGAIDQLTLLVDGKEHPARLLPGDEARRAYEEIVRKNRDPALLEWIGTGMFKTSVFPLPPGGERKVTLRYSQLCRKDHGLTDYLFPLATAKYTSHPVDRLDVRISIASGSEIKNVYSPTHAVDVKRTDNKHAQVSMSLANQIPGGDFRLLYDVGSGEFGTSVISYRRDDKDDGYFLLLTSPQIKPADEQRTAKTVLLVVDRSGSMSGEKIKQAKGALKFVLDNLQAGDLFNIVAYDGNVETFRPELQRLDDRTRADARGFVDGLFAGGSTNIDAALGTALGQLKDSSRANYVIFLTDGLPTAGQTNEAQIVARAQAENAVRARIFVFGVGYDVNSRLLDRLARENFGQSEYVRPNEDIEAHVASLYARIASPVMTDVAITFAFDAASPGETSAVNRIYPGRVHDLFAGEQLVVVGRYRRSGAAKVTLQGKVGSQQRKFDFPADLTGKSNDESNVFVEKLWATRRVGQIIDELDLHGRNPELVQELVELSTRYGILTPYTSFLADERTDRHDLAGVELQVDRGLEVLKEATGESGVAQRAAKGLLQNAQKPSYAAPSDLAVAPSANFYYDAKKDKQVAVDTVQNVGRKTFYRRGNVWVDGSLTKEQEEHAIRVERFGPRYFELVNRLGKDAARYFGFDEQVTVELDGQAYSF